MPIKISLFIGGAVIVNTRRYGEELPYKKIADIYAHLDYKSKEISAKTMENVLGEC